MDTLGYSLIKSWIAFQQRQGADTELAKDKKDINFNLLSFNLLIFLRIPYEAKLSYAVTNLFYIELQLHIFSDLIFH